jgi:hypothetical protein
MENWLNTCVSTVLIFGPFDNGFQLRSTSAYSGKFDDR